MIVVRFLFIFVPFVYATKATLLENGGDYMDEYNASIEYDYYTEYLDQISLGNTGNTISPGYSIEVLVLISPDFEHGYDG